MINKYLPLIRFLISGGTAAVVLMTLLYLLTELAGIWYIESSIIAFIIAFFVSFTLHKFWTFQDFNISRAPTQLFGHAVVGLCNLGLNTLFLFALVQYIQLHYLVAQILVSGFLAISSFFIYKYSIFKNGNAGAAPEKYEY